MRAESAPGDMPLNIENESNLEANTTTELSLMDSFFDVINRLLNILCALRGRQNGSKNVLNFVIK